MNSSSKNINPIFTGRTQVKTHVLCMKTNAMRCDFIHENNTFDTRFTSEVSNIIDFVRFTTNQQHMYLVLQRIYQNVC